MTLAQILLVFLVMYLIMLNAILVIPPHFGYLTIVFILVLEEHFQSCQTVRLAISLALFVQINLLLAQSVTLATN